MSHVEQMAFFQLVANRNPVVASTGRVLEIGSYDVNGSVREMFSTPDYTGCDLTAGPGVDIVSFGHELAFPDDSYDLVISGECFEHDPHWPETFANMVRMTRPGGIVAFTCASRGRLEHGTRRTNSSESPGTQSEGIDYYLNLTADDFAERGLTSEFSTHRFWTQPWSFDLYFAGVLPGPGSARLPEDQDVRALNALTPRGDKVARIPLRAVSGLKPETYQPLALKYWDLSQRARRKLRQARSRLAPAKG